MALSMFISYTCAYYIVGFATRYAVQGWPTRPDIAAAYKSPQLDIMKVSASHALIGNGIHLPNLAMVYLAAFMSVKLFMHTPDKLYYALSDPDTHARYSVVCTVPDGRCLAHTLHLALKASQDHTTHARVHLQYRIVSDVRSVSEFNHEHHISGTTTTMIITSTTTTTTTTTTIATATATTTTTP